MTKYCRRSRHNHGKYDHGNHCPQTVCSRIYLAGYRLSDFIGGAAALLLFAGYLALVVYNLRQKEPGKRIRIPWLLAIGILVQFGWEAGLLIGGIRSAGFSSLEQKLSTLVVNSLLETNLGMPYIYLLYIAYSRRFTEQLTRRSRTVSFTERIRENNPA